MSGNTLVIGTRGSSLALWQTEYVVERLRSLGQGLDIKIKTIKTRGDLVRDRALSQVGGKGLFVKEIETALQTGEIDLAVHSLKDMPTEQPDGLALGAILERADPRDALVMRMGMSELNDLASGARVGTSSLRRRAQMLAARPDLQILDLRGNIDTRLRKLHEGQFDAVILAAAGLVRLGHADEISQFLPVDVMLPAVGQGALCVEVRAGDDVVQPLVDALDHLPTRQAIEAERAFLRLLEGGCQVPIGAYAQLSNRQLYLRGVISSVNGDRIVRVGAYASSTEAERLGTNLAQQALAEGGESILEDLRRAS